MKKLIYIYLNVLFSLLTIYACKPKEGYIDSERFTLADFIKIDTLHSQTLLFDEPVLRPIKSLVVDSFLFLINFQTEYQVDRYNLVTKKKTGELISFGSGPNEIIAAIAISATDSNVMVFDGQSRRALIYDKHSFCFDAEPEPVHTISFTDYIDNILMTPDQQIISTARNKDLKKISTFDITGELLNSFGEYPMSQRVNADTFELSGAYPCTIGYNPSNKTIVAGYKMVDLIEIYDESGNLQKRIHGPDGFYPSVKTINDGQMRRVSSDQDSKFAYSCPIIYNEDIYILYSGKRINSEEYKSHMDKLLVFDKSGNPKRAYHLKTPIFNFTIDDDGILYGITDTPEFQIVQMQPG